MLYGLSSVALGIMLLTFGGDRLVLAAARVSKAWGVSPILIGALVVGIGTSAPEFLVSLVAASRGGLDLAIGNVAGSNVANLTLVLGASVLLSPLSGQGNIIRREGVLMFASLVALTALTWDGVLTVLEGVFLLAGMAAAIGLLYRWARRDDRARRLAAAKADDMASTCKRGQSLWVDIALGILALLAVLGGAELLVRGAQEVAYDLGFSQAFIGLTLVAVGTSLPELATALAAAYRRENDLLIGNVVGSNLFNSLAVTGGAALIGGGPLTSDFRMVMLTMVSICILAGIFTKTGNRLVRSEGVALLAAYGVFVYLLV